jgi:hypothetical protein
LTLVVDDHFAAAEFRFDLLDRLAGEQAAADGESKAEG